MEGRMFTIALDGVGRLFPFGYFTGRCGARLEYDERRRSLFVSWDDGSSHHERLGALGLDGTED